MGALLHSPIACSTSGLNRRPAPRQPDQHGRLDLRVAHATTSHPYVPRTQVLTALSVRHTPGLSQATMELLMHCVHERIMSTPV